MQVLANFLSIPLASGGDSDATGWPHVAFDLDPTVVEATRKLGRTILYGDGSRLTVFNLLVSFLQKLLWLCTLGRRRQLKLLRGYDMIYISSSNDLFLFITRTRIWVSGVAI